MPPQSRIQPTKEKKEIAIIGAGLSGLYAAWLLKQKEAESGCRFIIDIYEASSHVGGRMRSANGTTEGQGVFNLGAEIIDPDHRRVQALCKTMNIELEQMHLHPVMVLDESGVPVSESIQSEFQTLHQEVEKSLIALKENPEAAARLDQLSVADYLKGISQISNACRHIAGGIFRSDYGRNPERCSALSFVHEIGRNALWPQAAEGECYRVKNGTDEIARKLWNQLNAQGVRIHKMAPVMQVQKHPSGNFTVTFNNSVHKEWENNHYDAVVFANQLPALKNLSLSEINFPDDLQKKALENTQYTSITKIFVPYKKRPESLPPYVRHAAGFDAWASDQGVTFFIGGEQLHQMEAEKRYQFCLKQYANALNLDIQTIFEVPGKHMMQWPGEDHRCAGLNFSGYVSPAPAQALPLIKMSQMHEQFAQEGIGFVGSYLPVKIGEGYGFGFLENACAAAESWVNAYLGVMQKRQTGTAFSAFAATVSSLGRSVS